MVFDFLEIDKIKTHYLFRPGGENTVVILHGWGANLDTIVPIVNAIDESFTVYAYDAPGFGKSDPPREVFGMEEYSNFLKSFLDEFNIKKATFMGHSFGGKTLIKFFPKYPEMVKNLVLIDASGVKPKRSLGYYASVYGYKARKKIHLLSGRSLEDFENNNGSDDFKAASGIMKKCFVKVVNEHLERDMEKISCDVLLIWGDRDEDTPLYMAKTMEDRIKNSGLVVLEGAGHYSYLDRYGQFSAVIRSFLGGE